MKRRVLLSSLALTLCLVTGGCAAYGWADGPRTDTDDEPLSLRVAPVDTPAHLALDQSLLRQRLVDELEMEGFDIVSTDDAPAVRCAVIDHTTDGFDAELFAEISLACDIFSADGEATTTVDATGLAADELTPDARLPDAALRQTPEVETRAVEDAVIRIAPRVADAVAR